MISVMLALCGLATPNVEVQFPTPLTDERLSYNSRTDSDVTPYYVINDASFPLLRINLAGKTRRKRGSMSHGKGGQLRVRSKYRNSHHRDRYSNEYWIKRTIMTQYDRNTIPASRDVSAIPLYVGMSLYHILDTVITAHLSTCSK